MQFRLLLARTMSRTLYELEHSMSAHEFGLWQAEYMRSPWGPERIDMPLAMLTALTANAHFQKERGGKFEPSDFLPFMPREEEPPIEPAAFVDMVNHGRTSEH